MQAMRYHLAQVNIGRPRGPIDSAVMAEFVAALDPINALADGAPGFVWRLQTDDGNATSVPWPRDERVMVNMSVWTSLDALAGFVYRSAHAEVMRQRRKWFEAMEVYMALWWIRAGHVPTVEEAAERVACLEQHGPTRFAFTFRRPFAAPDAMDAAAGSDEDRCPAM